MPTPLITCGVRGTVELQFASCSVTCPAMNSRCVGRRLSGLTVRGTRALSVGLGSLRVWHPIQTNLSCHSQSRCADGMTSPQGWSGLICQWSIAQATLPWASIMHPRILNRRLQHAVVEAALCNNDTEKHRKRGGQSQ